MSTKRYVNTKMWSDGWFETLSATEKLVWIYLLTNDCTNMLGVYETTIKRINFDTGVAIETIRKALKGFEESKKVFFIHEKWVFLPNWIKNQSMNTNMMKSARQEFDRLPKVVIDFILEKGFESFESLSKGYLILPEFNRIEFNLIEDEFKLSERLENFKNGVLDENRKIGLPSVEVEKFILYWTESNKKGKMRFEQQPTWQTSGRLRTWKLNLEKRTFDGSHKQPNKPADGVDREWIESNRSILDEIDLKRYEAGIIPKDKVGLRKQPPSGTF